MDKDNTVEEEKVNQPDDAKIAGSTLRAVSNETASHQYQENSPAVNTNVNSESLLPSDSILMKIDSPENKKAKEAAEKAAYDSAQQLYPYDVTDCSKLDVSDARYCQPGSERHKAFLTKK